MQQVPGISPTGRYTTLLPLFLVLLATAVKEIIEDLVSPFVCVCVCVCVLGGCVYIYLCVFVHNYILYLYLCACMCWSLSSTSVSYSSLIFVSSIISFHFLETFQSR